MRVELHTTLGSFTVELYHQHAPRTARNFLELSRRGFYDGCTVHRLVPGFCIQSGDPTGTGRGGESIYGGPFADEISRDLKHTGAGILSMVRRRAAEARGRSSLRGVRGWGGWGSGEE